MTAHDPFEALGLGREASLADLRAARRRLAFDAHPDRGGDELQMKRLNAAFDAAVGHVTGRHPLPDGAANAVVDAPPPTATPRGSPSGFVPRGRLQRDDPSFVIGTLPAEAFAALLVVASWIGQVLLEEPPYLLDVHLYEPSSCWCRLRLLPDVASTAVGLTVASVHDQPAPDVDDVRDTWVHHLNQPGAFVN